MGTLANHRFPNAICNYGFSDAGINAGNTDMRRIMFAAKLRPEIITTEKPRKSNFILFELRELEGFLESKDRPKGVFIEFTPEGPELFIFTNNGAERCDKSVLPDDRYVKITRNLAIHYNYNPKVLAESLNIVRFELEGDISFMRLDAGLSEVKDAAYYLPISAAYSYCPTTLFELPGTRLVSMYYQDAKAAAQQGKIIYTADREFAYGCRLILERGYLSGGEEYYMATQSNPNLASPNVCQIRVDANGKISVKTK